MKNVYHTLLFIFSVMLISPYAWAQYEECGNDYNCYYEIKAKIEQERRVEEELEEESFRRKQLQLEERQLEEVEEQTEILEEQTEPQPLSPIEAP